MGARQYFKDRNDAVRDFFEKLREKHPQWKQKAIIEDTADRFFLSPRTIEAIVFREGIYE